jgi:hypothetical protein
MAVDLRLHGGLASGSAGGAFQLRRASDVGAAAAIV